MGMLHLTQVSFLKPILDGLIDSGASTRRILNRSGLDKFNLDNIENFVPVDSAYAFFDETCKQEGTPDLFEQFSSNIELLGLAQWGEMVAYAPDVLTACQLAVKYGNVINTHERASLTINGERTTYRQHFIDQPTKGRDQADHISLALAINGFRLAGGAKWAPLEIHLQSQTCLNLDLLLPIGAKTLVFLNRPATAIVFHTSMLAMPMLSSNVSLDKGILINSVGTSMAEMVESLVDSMKIGMSPSVNVISEIIGVPVRSLQRMLSREETSFTEVVERWRFKSAIKYLSETDLRIKEISSILKYSNASNFERAFRRWTNVTPEQYRKSTR